MNRSLSSLLAISLSFLVSGCVLTGAKTAREGERGTSDSSDTYVPKGSKLKCQCGSSFSSEDFYFP